MFDLAGHVEKMRAKHPNWSDRMLRNCLYWQNGARKVLKTELRSHLAILQAGALLEGLDDEWIALVCPEACGLNVTATMACQGITLEWPPTRMTYQVALIGIALPATNRAIFLTP